MSPYTIKRFLQILIVCLAIAILPAPAGRAASFSWTETDREGTPLERYDGDGLDVAVKDRVIYISTDKTVDIKVFTILGQLISSTTVGPGVHMMKVESRGIYILKAGSVTRRITI